MNLFILTNSPLNDIATSQTSAADAASQISTAANGAVDAAAGDPQSGILLMVIYIVGLFVLFYFFAVRPQKKREKELHAMQDAIKVGDWVMTSSGFYGKVADITNDVFVVEFGINKGVRVPVKKSEIFGNKEPNLTNKPVEESNSDSKK